MNYRNRLQPWCVLRLLPNLQRITVARFRRRSGAEAHLKVLQLMMQDVAFAIVFDVGEEDAIAVTEYRSPDNQDVLDSV